MPFTKNIPEVLCPTLKRFWERGVFDEYSEQHFFICAMNGNVTQSARVSLQRNMARLRESCFGKFELHDFTTTFIINFASKFEALCNYFGEVEMEKFMKNQFSAGKKHYDDNLFWQALSEIHMLCYFNGLGPAFVREAKYEPHLGKGKSNPEARLIYENDMILDIEVKTPCFPTREIHKEYLLPSVLLNSEGRDKLSNYCEANNIVCTFPRVKKIKDYINSAGKKFVVPKAKNHVNLLAINWTYSNFGDSGLFEPLMLFCNPINGLFVNKDIALGLEIENEALRKISAILLYQMPEEMLIFGDSRYLFMKKDYILIINPYAECVDEEIIFKMTHMKKQEILTDFSIGYFSLNPKDADRRLRDLKEIIESSILK